MTTTASAELMNAAPASRSKLWWVVAGVLALIAVGAAAMLITGGSTGGDFAPGSTATYQVQTAPLTISIVESGTIKSREQVVVKNEVEGRVTILSLIPEGTQVKKGQLLIELDASKLVDQQVDQQIQVQNAYAALIRARENLEVAKNQAQSDVSKAELDYEFAQINLKKYLEGDYPELVQSAQAAIKLAEASLQRAEETYGWSQKLAKDGYITQTELKKDELEKDRTTVDLAKARTRLETLQRFEHEKNVKELESNVEQTNLALDRVKRKASADVVQAEADLAAKQSEYDRQKAKLDKVVQQISKTKLYAPQDGLVVYATTGQQGFRSSAEPLDEGQEVRERQDLIYLPTTASMMANIKLHESALDKARVGLPVKLMIEALPGRQFFGRVARIAPLPDAQSSWMNPDLKVYNTEIHVDGDAADLRTGMTCTAEIIVEQHASAIAVPVQSVVRVGRQPTVWVVQGDRAEARPIEIGKDNNRLVHVIKGLKDGERILLNPPLDAASVADEKARVAAESNAPLPKISDLPPDTQKKGAGASGGPNGGGSNGGGSNGGDWKSMSPEERKKRYESMSPEEREKMKSRKKSSSGPGGPGGGAGAE